LILLFNEIHLESDEKRLENTGTITKIEQKQLFEMGLACVLPRFPKVALNHIDIKRNRCLMTILIRFWGQVNKQQ